MFKQVITLLLTLCLLFGCGVKSENDLPGDYQWTYVDGTIEIMIRHDHTYTETIKDKHQPERRFSGKWSIIKGDHTLLLPIEKICFDLLSLPPEVFAGSFRSQPVHTCFGPEKLNGKVRLEVSGDRAIYFTKIR